MKVIKEKHPLVMRWTHWVNFPVLAIMIWSGMLIYWANDEYSITLFGHTYVHFFPDWYYRLLRIPARLAEGMAFHFLFMWFFALNGFFYVLYTIVSGEWRQLLPNRHSFKEAGLVLLHDLHIRKTAPPQDKYNAAQRIAYTAIIIMGFGSLVTGLAIYKPVQLNWLCWLCGGYHLARIWHFVLTIGYVAFFLIHIIQVILAGWNNFRSVVSGFEVLDEEPPKKPLTAEQKIKRRNFISFAAFGAYLACTYGGWRWLYTSPDETPGTTAGVHKPLRKALNKTELFFRRLTFNENHLVKTYPRSMAAKEIRHNSDIGSKGALSPENWKLQVKKSSGETLQISLDELMKLPKTAITYDFKCVEAWDQISHWEGVSFRDFIAHFKLEAESKMEYVGIETPDQQYYVGIDMPSAMHPQTLLAYQMNDELLNGKHGQPLRLIIPVKYGIKNLKRIGTITFSNSRPRDYWAERGYDYYSGL